MDLGAPKILIMEDSIVSAMLMQATINRKKPDFIVMVCNSLKGGLEEFIRFRPNLVILDLTLSDSKPEETLKSIPCFRENACVIAVSGDLEYEHEARSMGANDFIGKGIGQDPQPFIEKITAVLPQCP